MSRIKVYLRLRGRLDDIGDLITALGDTPYRRVDQGHKVRGRVQPTDVLLVQLAAWDGVSTADQDSATSGQLLPAAALLGRLAPALKSVDRSKCTAELSISTIREEDQGGFELPAELVAAAGAANLALGVSILVMLDDYSLDNATDSVGSV